MRLLANDGAISSLETAYINNGPYVFDMDVTDANNNSMKVRLTLTPPSSVRSAVYFLVPTSSSVPESFTVGTSTPTAPDGRSVDIRHHFGQITYTVTNS